MAGMYSVSFENVSVSAAQDLFALIPAANKPCRLHSIVMAQSSDYGDAAAEGLRVKIIRGHTTVGSGGGTFTPVKLDPSNPTAAATTARINDTTIASSGTAADIWTPPFNAQGEYRYVPTPEEWAYWANAEYLVARLMAAPTDALSMGGTLTFHEPY